MRNHVVMALALAASGVAAAQTIERGGVISGVVTNDRGAPMGDVFIETWIRTGNGGLENGRVARTNAAGGYRINGVPAGEHVVVARVWHHTVRQGPAGSERSCLTEPLPPPLEALFTPRPIEKPDYAENEWFGRLPRWIPEPGPDERGRPRTIPTTFHPGVPELPRAHVVSIRGGEVRTGIDLQLSPTATTSIRGRIVPLPGTTIARGSEIRLRLPGAPSPISEHTTWVQPDNTFRFLRVRPGSYVLELQLQEAAGCDVIIRHSDDVRTQRPLDVPPAGLDDVVVPVAGGAVGMLPAERDARDEDQYE